MLLFSSLVLVLDPIPHVLVVEKRHAVASDPIANIPVDKMREEMSVEQNCILLAISQFDAQRIQNEPRFLK